MWNYEINVAKWIINKSGFNTNDYEVVYVMKKGDSYYAFHKDIDDSVINRFQEALNKLKQKPDEKHGSEFDKIIKRYFPREDNYFYSF